MESRNTTSSYQTVSTDVCLCLCCLFGGLFGIWGLGRVATRTDAREAFFSSRNDSSEMYQCVLRARALHAVDCLGIT